MLEIEGLTRQVGFDRTGLPQFVRCESPDQSGLVPFDACSCWAPDRSGNCDLDYLQGRRYFSDALVYAFAHASPLLIMYAINSMLGRPIYAVERGFIDSLSEKATAGALSPRAPYDALANEMREDPQALAEFKSIEKEAIKAWEIASSEHDPALLSSFLTDLLQGRYGQWIGGATWIIATASCNGTKH